MPWFPSRWRGEFVTLMADIMDYRPTISVHTSIYRRALLPDPSKGMLSSLSMEIGRRTMMDQHRHEDYSSWSKARSFGVDGPMEHRGWSVRRQASCLIDRFEGCEGSLVLFWTECADAWSIKMIWLWERLVCLKKRYYYDGRGWSRDSIIDWMLLFVDDWPFVRQDDLYCLEYHLEGTNQSHMQHVSRMMISIRSIRQPVDKHRSKSS